jgi:plasmid stabilization system protein ParE
MDMFAAEKRIGKTAASKLQSELRTVIRLLAEKKSGEAQASRVTPKYKNERLQRIVIQSPHYVFKLHYGFEGTKSNGVYQKYKPYFFLTLALDRAKVLDSLADDISQLRMEEVISKFNF